jgi:hypothetical protein
MLSGIPAAQAGGELLTDMRPNAPAAYCPDVFPRYAVLRRNLRRLSGRLSDVAHGVFGQFCLWVTITLTPASVPLGVRMIVCGRAPAKISRRVVGLVTVGVQDVRAFVWRRITER